MSTSNLSLSCLGQHN